MIIAGGLASLLTYIGYRNLIKKKDEVGTLYILYK